MPAKQLLGIGVDGVSWNRIQRFWQAHGAEASRRLLTPSEQKSLSASPDPVTFFARLWAAKEAYFKALGLGHFPDLAEIDVNLEEGNQFSVRHCEESRPCAQGRDDEATPSPGVASLPSVARNDDQVEGIFFPTPEGIGAKILLWQ